jgi:diguanylate cyclase (GGDEF)-like protein
VALPLDDGQTLVLDLPAPSILTHLDPDQIGLAILDSLGYVKQTWGLARRVPFFRRHDTLLPTELGPLLESSYRGNYGSLYLDGYRYFSGGLSSPAISDLYVLVVNAHDERSAKRQAGRSGRMANTLKRLGKSLSMNAGREDLAVSSAHVIASSTELAAVLLWTVNPEGDWLDLSASVGVNRSAIQSLQRLSPNSRSTCIAELVAERREAYFGPDVSQTVMTAQLEAKFCYLKPKGISVHPLVIQDRLLGVMELVGRDSDQHFEENLELFETIAEHVALALNASILFENVERLATHDPLTGIANHRRLHEYLEQRLEEAQRTNVELGVIMVDVDHFRSFNEEEGHDAGDEVLRLVSAELKDGLRPYDLAGRYGGEEFCLVLPGASRAAVEATAERLRQRIEAIYYVTKSGRTRQITASFGAAVFPKDGLESSRLIKAADIALYESKRSGRNRVTMYREEQPAATMANWLGEVRDWAPKSELEEGDQRLARLAPWIARASLRLDFSPQQTEILRTLIWLVPLYEKMASKGQASKLQALSKKDVYRVVLPHLEAILKGSPRPPLLTRVAQAIFEFDRTQEVPKLDSELALIFDDPKAA